MTTRREILKSLTVGGTGLIAVSGAGVTSAHPPCHKHFSCGPGTAYVKYELVERDDGTCYFEEETETGISEDSLTITETKGGDTCEPLAVTWDETDFVATKVMAFGGGDCETVPDPDGSYDADPASRETEPNSDEDAGLDTPSGTVAAISNLQFCVEPACPRGTRALARYETNDGRLVFESGEDVVEFSNVVTDGDGVKGFDFSATDGSDSDSASEVLTTVTVEYGPNVETFEVDPDFDVDKRSGSVDLTGQEDAIDDVLFCQAVYVQADFVVGDVIESFCDDGGNNTANYGSRKISSVTWSSYNGQLDGTQGQFDGRWVFHETDGEIEVEYDPDDYSETVALAVYRVADPVFQDNTNIDYGETKCRQYLIDSVTDEPDVQDGTLRADLPSI